MNESDCPLLFWNLFPELFLVGCYAQFEGCQIARPIFVASITVIGDDILRILLKHLKADLRFDNLEVVGMNIACLGGGGCPHHMAGGASAGSLGFRSIIVLGMHADGFGIGKLLIFSMTRKAKVVVKICFH